jgi:D-alanyl-D-alanine carboxypeptidase/D-alanyl-D-alanine-endopeptidase (penicillin-binding protein 4)
MSEMRRLAVMTACAATALLSAAGPGAAAATPQATASATPQPAASPTPQIALNRALTAGIRAAGASSSAYVLDLTTGQTLFSSRPDTPRLPASVEKVYTTSTTLLKFGPSATLTTSVLGSGRITADGTFVGTLYLQGGGDPTFGSSSFDSAYYGTGATVQQLVSGLVSSTGITAVDGRILGDQSYFDPLRGTAPYGYRPSTDIEGQLGGLIFNRGFLGSGFQPHPAQYAAQQLAAGLKAANVTVPRGTRIGSGVAPPNALRLASVNSPDIATLIQLTNTPSDNFFAEMLLKDLGARFGGLGSSAAGVAVVRSELASEFGIRPRLEDGSGLARFDHTSARQVVTVLQDMANDGDFVSSLAVAGESGTLEFEMNHTAAQGRCRGKTGTLHDVSNLVGYCRARDGHTLAFAFLMNSINPDYAHPIQDRMAVALAKYNAIGGAVSADGVAPTRRAQRATRRVPRARRSAPRTTRAPR